MSKGNRTRRMEAGLLPTSILCSARKKDGTPCRRSPIKGASVCRSHGGAAPQVVAAARRRLMGASNNVAVLLLKIAEDEKTPPAVRLAAIKDVLDRAGVTVKQEVEITVQPWQQIVDGIVAEVPDGSTRSLGAMDGEVFDAEMVADLAPAAALDPPPTPTPPPGTEDVRIPSRRQGGRRVAGQR